MKKYRIKAMTIVMLLPFLFNRVKAEGVSLDEALSLIDSYLQPVASAIYIVAPTVAIVSAGISFFRWLSKDEDERERSPFTKTVKNIVFACVIFFLLATILKIFGIPVSEIN